MVTNKLTPGPARPQCKPDERMNAACGALPGLTSHGRAMHMQRSVWVCSTISRSRYNEAPLTAATLETSIPIGTAQGTRCTGRCDVACCSDSTVNDTTAPAAACVESELDATCARHEYAHTALLQARPMIASIYMVSAAGNTE